VSFEFMNLKLGVNVNQSYCGMCNLAPEP